MLRFVQFFFSLPKSWSESVSMVTTKWLFRHLPRSKRKSEIDSVKKKQENWRFVVTKAFAEPSKCPADILNFLKPSKLHFLLRACVPDLTDC